MLWRRSASFTRNHADVLRHRDDHLAEVLGLRDLAALELELADLRDAVDEIGDLLAEHLDHLGPRRERVLHRVVEERGRDRVDVHAQVGEDPGDRHRMGEVGLAALSHLARVRLGGVHVGPHDHVDVGVGRVLADRIDDVVEAHSWNWRHHGPPRGGRSSIAPAVTCG
jgi:hypothetical protein